MRVSLRVADNPRERARVREPEDPPSPWLRVEPVREVSFRPAGLKDERQPPVVGERLEPYRRRQPVRVHRRLPLHPG